MVVVRHGGGLVLGVSRLRGGRMDRLVMPVIGGSGGVSVVIMTFGGDRRRLAGNVLTMVGMGGRMGLIVLALGLADRMSGVVVVTLAGVRPGTGGGTVSGIVAVIVVRLVLVAHCDSVPLPLFAVIAAKSV